MLRGLSFVALFQAAGGALFLVIFDPRMRRAVIVQVMRWSALAALVLLTAQYLMESARMSGDYSGLFDAEFQSMVAQSSLLLIYLLRTLAVVLFFVCIRSSDVTRRWPIIIAALGVVISFALTGHTAARPYNPWLSLLLMVHIAAVMFWFGSLLPLLAINQSVDRASAALVVEDFSRVAVRVVPALFVAGAALIAALFYSPRNFLEPYGLILLGKLFAFALLMGLAALNRWRLGPQLGTSPRASRSFSRSVLGEYALIAAAVMATAALTTFFSPSEVVWLGSEQRVSKCVGVFTPRIVHERARACPFHVVGLRERGVSPSSES